MKQKMHSRGGASQTSQTSARRGAAPSEPKAPRDGEVLYAKDPAQEAGRLKAIGGSMSDDWNHRLVNDVLTTVWLFENETDKERKWNAAIGALVGIRPASELEGMVAAQLLASHFAAMECYRRAMIREQTFEGRNEALKQANKLSRTHAALLEALNRHRGKGQQKVTVEHVHVHSGGQAIVGSVTSPGGGMTGQSEEQPHAQQLGHASEQPMPSADPARDAVPITGDGKRAL